MTAPALLNQIGARLDVSAARLNCAMVRKTLEDGASDEWLELAEHHEELRAQFRAALSAATGESAAEIERRLAL